MCEEAEYECPVCHENISKHHNGGKLMLKDGQRMCTLCYIITAIWHEPYTAKILFETTVNRELKRLGKVVTSITDGDIQRIRAELMEEIASKASSDALLRWRLRLEVSKALKDAII